MKVLGVSVVSRDVVTGGFPGSLGRIGSLTVLGGFYVLEV